MVIVPIIMIDDITQNAAVSNLFICIIILISNLFICIEEKKEGGFPLPPLRLYLNLFVSEFAD